MSTEFQFDVFLSHSAKNEASARPLAERARQDGLKAWFDSCAFSASSPGAPGSFEASSAGPS
jgi:hypothetical protein